MFAPRMLDEKIWAAPQIGPSDLAEAVAMGVRVIVNNRPDDEDAGQPSSAEMEASVRAAGLDYVHVPIAGMPSPEAVSRVASVIESGLPALMFCRSGTRSTIAWALAMRSLGRAEPDELRATAAAAGYDLSRLPL